MTSICVGDWKHQPGWLIWCAKIQEYSSQMINRHKLWTNLNYPQRLFMERPLKAVIPPLQILVYCTFCSGCHRLHSSSCFTFHMQRRDRSVLALTDFHGKLGHPNMEGSSRWRYRSHILNYEMWTYTLNLAEGKPVIHDARCGLLHFRNGIHFWQLVWVFLFTKGATSILWTTILRWMPLMAAEVAHNPALQRDFIESLAVLLLDNEEHFLAIELRGCICIIVWAFLPFSYSFDMLIPIIPMHSQTAGRKQINRKYPCTGM